MNVEPNLDMLNKANVYYFEFGIIYLLLLFITLNLVLFKKQSSFKTLNEITCLKRVSRCSLLIYIGSKLQIKSLKNP